jgi:hypothetical protein
VDECKPLQLGGAGGGDVEAGAEWGAGAGDRGAGLEEHVDAERARHMQCLALVRAVSVSASS